jgi:hypothetical protein
MRATVGAEFVITENLHGEVTATVIPKQLQQWEAGDLTDTTGLTPPPLHTYFNFMSNDICAVDSCETDGGNQYAIQEIPGNYYMGQEMSGTVRPNVGHNATYGEAFIDWPGESGDSGPLNYSPQGDTVTEKETADITVGIDVAPFTFDIDIPVYKDSTFGPVFPSGANVPAFGSFWQGNNHSMNGTAFAEDIHLGTGQSAVGEMQQVIQ